MALADSPKGSHEDLMINMEVVGVGTDGINFVIYDHITNQVIDTRGFY